MPAVGRRPSKRMTDRELKSSVLRLSKMVRALLRAEAPLAHIRLSSPRRTVAKSTRTSGYYVRVGGLSQGGPSLSIWLDRYSGHPEPRVWYGFSASSLSSLTRIRRLAPAAGYGKPPRIKTQQDHAGDGFVRYVNPLARDEFDVLIEDRLPRVREFYLGAFDPQPWPLTARPLVALAREIAAFIVRFDGAIGDFWGAQKPLARAWGRADPMVEEAAILHVTSWLKRRGYRVRSREDQICGYDLHATSRAGELHVEVKGTATAVPCCYLSANEWEVAQKDPLWRLVIVTRARTAPRRHEYTLKQLRRTFSRRPLEWRLVPR